MELGEDIVMAPPGGTSKPIHFKMEEGLFKMQGPKKRRKAMAMSARDKRAHGRSAKPTYEMQRERKKSDAAAKAKKQDAVEELHDDQPRHRQTEDQQGQHPKKGRSRAGEYASKAMLATLALGPVMLLHHRRGGPLEVPVPLFSPGRRPGEKKQIKRVRGCPHSRLLL